MTGERPIGEDDLQAFIDGRLPPERVQAVTAYLKASPETKATLDRDAALRAALRERLAFKAQEPIPARLRIASLMAGQRPSTRRRPAFAAMVAGLVLGLAVGAVGGALWGAERVQEVRVADDAIAAYRTYVSEKLHPVEVAADQETHLVQWLSRRVGKPLVAPDLKAQGYRLIGGRLLPAGSEAAALFMYEDERGDRLTLYVRSGSTEAQTSFRFEAKDGVSAFSWIDNGLSYVVSARTDRSQLLGVAEVIDHQFEASPAEPKRPL